MSDRPSQKLLRWVESESKRVAAGTQLPVDLDLAKAWSLSERTVKRVMKQCEDKGLVVRVPGKGTFVPPIPLPGHTDGAREATLPKHSVQAAVESLTHAIRSGELRKGDAFPSMKYMRLQYRLAPATVHSSSSKTRFHSGSLLLEGPSRPLHPAKENASCNPLVFFVNIAHAPHGALAIDDLRLGGLYSEGSVATVRNPQCTAANC